MSIWILLVDDDQMIRESLATYLEDEGMCVVAVNTGEKAIDIINSGRSFDVCIIDIRLPGMDGNDTIRTLLHLHPYMGIIVHTGSINYAVPSDIQMKNLPRLSIFYKPLRDMAPLANTARNWTENCKRESNA